MRLQEVYKSLLVASPEAMFGKIPRIVAQYVDFGETKAVLIESRHGRVMNSRIPAFLAAWFMEATQGYFTGALELAGAKTIRIPMATPVKPDGVIHGVEAVQAKYDVTWG